MKANYLRGGSLALDDLQPLGVVEPELLPPDPVPPGLIVERDDVQGCVAQTLDLRVAVVHQVDLVKTKSAFQDFSSLNDGTSSEIITRR